MTMIRTAEALHEGLSDLANPFNALGNGHPGCGKHRVGNIWSGLNVALGKVPKQVGIIGQLTRQFPLFWRFTSCPDLRLISALLSAGLVVSGLKKTSRASASECSALNFAGSPSPA
ncbi:MAG: hypothetical protein ACM3SW_15690 [Actinomycetota bacterium]